MKLLGVAGSRRRHSVRDRRPARIARLARQRFQLGAVGGNLAALQSNAAEAALDYLFDEAKAIFRTGQQNDDITAVVLKLAEN